MVNEMDVADRLRPVLMKLSRELRREVADLGISGGQASLLFAIKRARGAAVGELAAQERMSPAAMTRHLDRLEATGLVRREADPEDGRRQLVAVTKEGQSILRKVKSRRTAWLAARLGELSAAELRTLDRAVGPLGRLLEVGR